MSGTIAGPRTRTEPAHRCSAEPVVDLATRAVRRYSVPATAGSLEADLEHALALCASGVAAGVAVPNARVTDPETALAIGIRCADHGVVPSMLTLTIPEEAIVGHPRMAGLLVTELHRLGTDVCVDGFGRTRSGFGYLRNLPVSSISLRRMATPTMLGTPEALVVEGAVSLASSLGIRTVADGIDDEPTALTLEELGVSEGRGACFGGTVDLEGKLP